MFLVLDPGRHRRSGTTVYGFNRGSLKKQRAAIRPEDPHPALRATLVRSGAHIPMGFKSPLLGVTGKKPTSTAASRGVVESRRR